MDDRDGPEYLSDNSELPLEKFFEMRIEEQTIDTILEKQKFVKSAKVPEYESFDHCKEVMLKGIEVIKHNYSNKD